MSAARTAIRVGERLIPVSHAPDLTALGLGDVDVVLECTTNALAPLVKVIDLIAGIERTHMTTIHCYTNSQPMIDAPRGDLARSRGSAQSMVLTNTSATELIGEVLPHLRGRISGTAARAFGWYDNEWGGSARMLDLARFRWGKSSWQTYPLLE